MSNRAGLLARGDRRDFVAIDPKGGTHSLARRIEGATAKDVRARMADVDIEALAERRRGQGDPIRAARQAGAGQSAVAPPPVAWDGARAIPSDAADRSRYRQRGATGGGRSARATGAAGGMLKGAAKLAGGIASAFESLLGGGSKPAKDESKRPLDAAPMPPNAEHEEAIHREQEQKSARRQKYS